MNVSTSVIFRKGLWRDYVTIGYGGIIRPGIPDIVVSVVSSDPGIVAIDKPQVVFTAGSSQVNFAYRPIAAGRATLSLNPPDGYLAHPTQGSLAITVDAAKLTLGTYSGSQIGRDLQMPISFVTEVPFQQPTAITISSSDPSRLLISPDLNTLQVRPP